MTGTALAGARRNGRLGGSSIFGAESRANPWLDADVVAHDRVGDWRQCLGGGIRARTGHTRSSTAGDRVGRCGVCAGRTGGVRSPLVRGLPVARSSTRRVRIARRRPRVAERHPSGRPLVGHVCRRGDARACGSPRTLAGRWRRPQSPRVAERVWRQGGRSRRRDSRSTASRLMWPASRRIGSKVCISAVPLTSGCRCGKPHFRESIAAAGRSGCSGGCVRASLPIRRRPR